MIDINKANAYVVERFMEARPVATTMAKAIEVVPGLHENMLLHAGPPVTWERMSGPMRGAMIGALLFEGKAKNPEEAEKLLASGKIDFAPCNDHMASGPMAGVISPSQLVYVIENQTHGIKCFSNMNEGRGNVLRMGAYKEEVLNKLRLMESVVGPTVKSALEAMGGIDIRMIISKSLHMGDDGHNREDAASILWSIQMAPIIAKVAKDTQTAHDVIKFLGENPLTMLNPIMAGCKTMTAAGDNVEGSTIVTVMARNGTDFGIKVSGLGNQWFTAQAPIVKALYFPGFKESDACRDIGDSTITETAGIGGFAMAAAPALVTFIGGVPRDATNTTLDMYEITFAEHKQFTIPALDFRGTPTGIDILKVVEKQITPRVNTGVAHKDPGVGQVGGGVVSAPMKCFEDAVTAFAEKYGL
ncbi:MAG: hypothetical protein BGO78_16680 [Chloroflexi bacterium 44-23]|nr:MAG: hypothetical protein BGO78_16680 [Chloroflexi bacterium 44-23]